MIMAKHILEMTDEEIMNMSPDDFEPEEVNEELDSEEEESTESEEQEETEQTEEESDEESSEVAEEATTEEEDENPSDEEVLAKTNPNTKKQTKVVKEEVKKEPTEDTEPASVETPELHKAVYDKIMNTPIKANGKDIKLKSVDEAVQLIQMGANYTKKMASLKPHLKLLKTLENNSLLNENDINLLIDLKQKKPEAIAKLLSDAEINPLDVDLDDSKNYVPQNHTVTDKQMELDEVINELQSSQHYTKLSQVVAGTWDDSSKQALFNKPEMLRTLHEHMVPDAQGNSIYEYVSAEVERRKILGQLKGMSDYDAYISVGDDLYEQHKQQQAIANTVSKRVVKPATKTNNVDPQTVKQQKQAAAPTRAKVTTNASSELNPLALSDEEFEKITANRY